MYSTVLLVALVTSSVSSQEETFAGECPFNQVGKVSGFDHKRFEGTWYEIQRYHKSETMDCVETSFRWEAFDVFAGKYNMQHKERNLEKNIVIDEPREASQAFRQPAEYFSPKTKWPFWVVQTDYDNYALVWGCWDDYTQDKRYNAQRLTVMSRKRDFQVDSVPTLRAALGAKPFESSRLKPIIQDERCPGSEKNEGAKHDDKLNDNGGGETSTVSTIISIILTIVVSKLL